jgi:hypothetical protein
LGGGLEQVVVEAEEVGQRLLCGGEPAQPGRNWWLEVVVGVAVEDVLVAFPGAVGGQPCEVERPEITRGEFGANSDDRRQQRFGVVVKSNSPASSSLVKSSTTNWPATQVFSWSPAQYCSTTSGASRSQGRRKITRWVPQLVTCTWAS